MCLYVHGYLVVELNWVAVVLLTCRPFMHHSMVSFYVHRWFCDALVTVIFGGNSILVLKVRLHTSCTVYSTVRTHSFCFSLMSSMSTAVPPLMARPRASTADLAAYDELAAKGAMTDSSDEVVAVFAQLDSDQIGMVQAADRIDEILLSKYLATRKTIHSLRLVPDPENRGTEGVNPLQVTSLASTIINDGFSWTECAHATCIEEAPGQTLIEDFATPLLASTDMAPCRKGETGFGCLSGTHCNTVLRNVNLQAVSTEPLMSTNGRYSVDVISRRDAEFAKAVREGIPWLVYSWKVRLLYPRVPDLISNARNSRNRSGSKESEMQVMLRLHQLARAHTDQTRAVPWADIVNVVLKTRPPCAKKVDALVTFLIGKSGGTAGQHLKYLSVFHRNHVLASERFGCAMALYEALATFPHQFLAMALLQANWVCPSRYVHNGECNFVGAGDVAGLRSAFDLDASNRDHDVSAVIQHKRVHAAGKLLTDARTCVLGHLGNDASAWSNEVVKCFARLDTQVARYLLNKETKPGQHLLEFAHSFGKELSQADKTLPENAFEHVLDVKETTREQEATSNPASAKAKSKAKAKVKASAAPSLHLYEVDNQGAIVSGIGKLRARGFDVEHTVSLSIPLGDLAAGDLWVVTACNDDTVTLAGLDKTAIHGIGVDKFLASAKAETGSDRVLLHPGWPSKRLSMTPAAAKCFAQARVWATLEVAQRRTCAYLPLLIDVLLKPSKMLRAKKDLGVGALILFPEATGIKVCSGASAVQESEKASSVEVFLENPPFGFTDRMFLSGTTSGDYVAPYWFVEPASADDTVNMMPIVFKLAYAGGLDATYHSMPDLRIQVASALAFAELKRRDDDADQASAAVLGSMSSGTSTHVDTATPTVTTVAEDESGKASAAGPPEQAQTEETDGTSDAEPPSKRSRLVGKTKVASASAAAEHPAADGEAVQPPASASNAVEQPASAPEADEQPAPPVFEFTVPVESNIEKEMHDALTGVNKQRDIFNATGAIVMLPALVNFVPVKAGSKLCSAKPPSGVAKTKPVTPITIASVRKRNLRS